MGDVAIAVPEELADGVVPDGVLPDGSPARPDLTVTTGTDSTASRLVAAATEVFAEKGYDGAGVAEIARRAGLTTGAIYSRFSGKAELLAEAISASGGGELDRLFAQENFRGRANDLLAIVGSHLLVSDLGPNRALLLEAFTAARRDPEVADALRATLAERATQLAELIDESKRNGLIDPELDTAAIVHFAHAVGLGFVLFDAVGAEPPDGRAWEHLIGHLLASVTPAATAATAATTGATTVVTETSLSHQSDSDTSGVPETTQGATQ